jgi:serine/threonine protein kinase
LAATLGADRFLREVQVAAQLSHPHILPMYDSGEADGVLYYVMPYVEGETLKEKMEQDGKMGVEEALRLTREVADALAYAHGRSPSARGSAARTCCSMAWSARISNAWARSASLRLPTCSSR